MAGEYDPTKEPARDIDIGLQEIRIPARNIHRALQAVSREKPDLISAPESIRNFIQQTPEYSAAGTAVIDLVSQKRGQGLLISDALADEVLNSSLLKIEANVLQDIWGHAFYHVFRKDLFTKAGAIDPASVVTFNVPYDTLEREADSVGHLFQGESWYLEEVIKFHDDWEKVFAGQNLWPVKIVEAAFLAQEDIQNTKGHRTNGLAQAGLLNTGYANAVLMYASVLRSLFPALESTQGMNQKEAGSLEQSYIHHFSKQAGANISSVPANRRLSMGTDHIYNPQSALVDNLAHEATTRCVAFIDRFLVETYYDFRNYILRKHYQNSTARRLLLPDKPETPES